MNVASISERTFYRHTSSYVNPVVIQQWREHQQQLLDSLADKEDGLVLAGDGRCDSPGYCAKYGSYTLIEEEMNRVVDFELVQVGVETPLPPPPNTHTHTPPPPDLHCHCSFSFSPVLSAILLFL